MENETKQNSAEQKPLMLSLKEAVELYMKSDEQGTLFSDSEPFISFRPPEPPDSFRRR